MSSKLVAGNARKLIYQIWMLAWGSFAEVARHIEYLKEQGLDIDYAWLSPIFDSPHIDSGYDVRNYYEVHGRFGSMDDFDSFVEAMKALEIGVLLDLPLNHVSDQHEWFQKALGGDEEFKNYFLWTDEDLGWGNWFDGGTAFEYVPSLGQYYVHLFNKAQPDLNWRNSDVVAEFKKIIEFWSSRGVAGFRLDSAPFLVKSMHKTRLPRSLGAYAGVLYYYMRNETVAVLRELFGETDLFTISEAGLPLKHFANRLAGPKAPLSATLNISVPDAFDRKMMLVKAGEDINRLRKVLHDWSRVPWYVASLESHDRPRITSLTGRSGEELVAMMLEGKPQYACLYQGQEFGLQNPELSIDELRSDIMFEMQYQSSIQKGALTEQDIARMKHSARAYARTPLNLEECYISQKACLHAVARLINEWKRA